MNNPQEIIKKELLSILSREDMDYALSGGNSNERIDRIVPIIRDAIDRSSLGIMEDSIVYFDGRCYRRIKPKELSALLTSLYYDLKITATDVRRISNAPDNAVFSKKYEVNPDLVVFDNGVYDIASNSLKPFSKDLITDYTLPYSYDMGALSYDFDNFIEEVLPDESERRILQEFFGMCYIDRHKLSVEKFLVLIGSGSNGKSVVFDVIKGVMGEDRISYLSPDQLQDNRQVIGVVGKRLNFSPDIRKGAAFDSALKALSSGQSVNGWKLYEGNITIQAPPLAFALNEMPYFRDMTDAFWRRLLLISFDITIPPGKQDKTLASRIIERERPAIFNWIMEGRRRLIGQNGEFTFSEKMNRAIARMREAKKREQMPLRYLLEDKGLSIEPQGEDDKMMMISRSELMKLLKWEDTPNKLTYAIKGLGGEKQTMRNEPYYRLYSKNERKN